LLYLCFGRLPIAAASDNAVAIARALLDRGADPNVFFTDGENHFTPLTGVMGEGERPPGAVPPHPQAEPLARLLLERGAHPHDFQGFYNTALRRDDDRWLELLWAHARTLADPVAWEHGGKRTLDFLIDLAVSRNHVKRMEWLLAHGANPNVKGHYSKQSAHKVALLRGLEDMAALLVRFGAEPVALVGQEAFHAACMRLDRETARRLLDGHPEYLRTPAPLMAAAQHDLRDVAALLLDLGMSPDLHDHGQRALHAAAANDSLAVAALLVERGAEIDARDWKYGGTPLGWALHLERPRIAALLGEHSRDVFSLAAAGSKDRLAQVLAAEPQLARAIHGNETPLFRLPQEEDRAIEIVELLLAHGADPTIRNGRGQTAADCAEGRGLDAAADRLRVTP
jgi:ankyrin repeat protein